MMDLAGVPLPVIVACVAMWLRGVGGSRRRGFMALAELAFPDKQKYGTCPRLDMFGAVLLPLRDSGRHKDFKDLLRCTPPTFEALVRRIAKTKIYKRRMRKRRGRPVRTSVAEEVALGLYALSGQCGYTALAYTFGVGGKGVVHNIVSPGAHEALAEQVTLPYVGQAVHLRRVRARKRGNPLPDGRGPRATPRRLQGAHAEGATLPKRAPVLCRRDRRHARSDPRGCLL